MSIPTSNPPRPPTALKNLAYVSNLRSSLTALVILHHAATSYGGDGRNVYQSSWHAQGSSPVLVGFNAVNQSFFMGTFMYLGGHFSRKALERKGSTRFVKDRVWRLGVPTVVYTLLGAPGCVAIVRMFEGKRIGMRWLVDYWKGMRGVRGPVWFTATLLMFDLSLVGIEWAKGRFHLTHQHSPTNDNTTTSHVGTLHLYASVLLTSAVDFFVRTIYPVGTILTPLKLNIGYVSQYVASYAFGVAAGSVDYAIPSPLANIGVFSLSITSSLALASSIRDDPRPLDKLKGGYTIPALSYAVWNNTTGYCLGTSLLTLYARFFTTSWGVINDLAYPAFMLHMLPLTVIACATDRWRASGVLKTSVVGASTILASWGLAWVGTGLWERCRRAVASIGQKGQ